MNKPVTILTGFLGAGKTTFLNDILQKNKDTRYAIIENEFGKQGIDNELIIHPDETLVTLNDGCLCCTLNDNLYDILNELHQRRDQFDEVIIEATGVADPSGLAQPFIIHPVIKKHFPLVATICLIDAEMIDTYLKETEEAANQITQSDILLINKTDLVTKEQIEQLKTRLIELNPIAKISLGNKDNFPRIDYKTGIKVLNKKLQNLEINEIEDAKFPVKKTHHHHHHEHTKSINSQSFVFEEHAFNYALLYQQLLTFLTFQSEGLYRMKGIFWIEGDEHKYILQSSGNRLAIEKQRLWQTNEERRSVIVFIGKNLQRSGFEKLLNRCIPNVKK